MLLPNQTLRSLCLMLAGVLLPHLALAELPVSYRADGDIAGAFDFNPHTLSGLAPIYVDASATGANDGTSWGDAFTSLQDALGIASAGNEIWVAEGVYKPGTNVTDSFELTGGEFYGGFPAGGGDGTFGARDPSTYLSILSGDIDQNDVNLDGNFIAESPADLVGTNSENLLVANFLNQSATLDGFVITGGGASSGLTGNALTVLGGSPSATFSLSNCRVSGHANGTFAIVLGRGVATNFDTCVFTGSQGIFTTILDDSTANRFIDCEFRNNGHPNRNGGAIDISTDSQFVNCLFAGNVGNFGGAVFADSDSTPSFFHCTFSGNKATNGGGAIYVKSGSEPSFSNSVIWNNEAIGATNTVLSSIFDTNVPNGLTLFTHCLIANSGGSHSWDSTAGIDGGGNLDIDPLFVTPVALATAPTTAGNLRLMSASPAIAAGDNTLIPAGVTTDLDGNDRLISTDVDLGAYESMKLNFAPGDVSVSIPDGSETMVTNWISNTSAYNNGAGFAFEFTLMSSTGTLAFDVPPSANAVGELSFAAAESGLGSATFSVIATDPGGNFLNSMPFTFTISTTGSIAYVDADAAPGGDGTSWATAYDKLQDAINIGLSEIEIWVAEGTYYPDEGAGRTDNDRSSVFLVAAGRGIYGGFDGTETARSQRNPLEHICVLSGDLDQNDAVSEGVVTPSGLNAYNVVRSAGSPGDAALDGFTITSGWANHPDALLTLFRRGGGMLISTDATNLVLENLTFFGNTAISIGGGLYVDREDVELVNCRFIGNESQSTGGGAIYVRGAVFPLPGSLRAIGCVFKGNQATGNGGAIQLDGADCDLINCSFGGNRAASGGDGGCVYATDTTARVINCVMWGNQDDSGAGTPNAAIFTASGILPGIRNSVIEGSGGSGAGWVATLGADLGNNQDSGLIYRGAPDSSTAPNSTGDLRMLPGSSAIDVGIFALIPPEVTTDPNFRPRRFGVRPDAGAFEFAPGPVIYVDADATGVPAGDNWTDAFTNIQDALTYASDGVEIWVAEGVYRPDESMAGDTDDPADLFLFEDAFSMYGGFNGTETQRNMRAPDTNVTILSGDIDQNDVNVDGNDVAETTADIVGVNSYRIADTSSLIQNKDLTLDGFTITAGFRTNMASSGGPAGCNFAVANLTINDCVFIGNRNERTTSERGSALSVLISTVAITECEFIANRTIGSGSGGAGLNLFNSNGTLTNCTFDSNQSDGEGGALAINSQSELLVDGCTFTSNTADDIGGGIHNTGSLEVRGSSFDGNDAANGGGAIYNEISTCTISDTSFDNNGSPTSGFGGAISNEFTSPWINRCTFTGNEALVLAGAIFNDTDCDADIRNGSFTGNESRRGGAVFNISNRTRMSNCVFLGNIASSGEGGAVTTSSTGASPSFDNCTFSGNMASSTSFVPAGALGNEGSAPNLVHNSVFWGNTGTQGVGIPVPSSITGATVIEGSLAEGLNPGGTNLDGTIALNNPLLDANGRPPGGSSVIDNGVNALNAALVDRDGNLRIFNGTIDIGAFEFGSTPPASFTFAGLFPSLDPGLDFNLNARSNYFDYAAGVIPTSGPDGSVNPVLSTDTGVLFFQATRRTGVTDVFDQYEKSTNLVDWIPMVEGVDYLVESVLPLSLDREQVTLRLLTTPDPVTKRLLFWRQAFSTIAPAP